jgi:hypothetical protein
MFKSNLDILFDLIQINSILNLFNLTLFKSIYLRVYSIRLNIFSHTNYKAFTLQEA